MRRQRPVLLLLCAMLPACLVTADESLWKARVEASVHDARGPDRPVGDAARRDASGDVRGAPDLVRSDVRLVDGPPKIDSRRDAVGPKPDLSCGKLVLTVAAAQDDGVIFYPYLAPNGDPATNEIWMGYWDGRSEWGYFRFTLPQALPAGTTLSDARLSLWGVSLDAWGPTAALELFVEDSKDAPVVASEEDAPFLAAGRPVTNVLRWPATGGLAWGLNAYNVTPNLAPLLQAVLNSKGGLAGGAHVQVWIRGAQAVHADLSTHDFAKPGYSANPHQLVISFCK